MRILLVDNYDSFTYNLVHLLARTNGGCPVVLRNDDPRFRIGDLNHFDAVIISPGPGRPDNPADFGISREILATGNVPTLGVCLGHQGICSMAGARVVQAPTLMHGRLSDVYHAGAAIFADIPSPFRAVRYHSLIADELPEELDVLAQTPDSVLMGVVHKEYPQWGIQFHPESIGTEHGETLLRNFCDLSAAWNERRNRRVHGRAPWNGVNPRLPPAPRTRPTKTTPKWHLHTRVLPALASAEAVFEALFAESPAAFWLDSSGGDPSLSRFSFMGDASGPYARIVYADVNTGVVTVETAGERQKLKSGFFEWLKADLAENTVAVPDMPFEFALGWVGYLGYELKAETGGTAAHQSPYPDATMLFADRALAFDHANREIWLLALVPTAGDAGEAQAWLDRTATALRAIPASPKPAEALGDGLGALELRHSRRAYLDRIQRSLDAIAAGESYEICLTNMVSARGRLPPLAAYRQLRRISPGPFAAYLRFNDMAVLSSSPERFLGITRDGTVQAKPIKGTRPRGRSTAEDRAIHAELASCEKDRSENLMIVDLLRNDLGVCAAPDSVRVDKIFDIETYATVHQMVSTISARLHRDVSPVDCVRAAFPGGSMTGAPKIRTMSIIDALEDGPRSVYSGSLGYFSLNGSIDLNIVIRTLVIAQDKVRYGVGGAIVALSDPEEEYEETAVKTSPLSRLTGQDFPERR